MRPQKIVDEDLLAALSKVFRSKGYEGASLQDLSTVTGLKKASLYHRFPNGKKEMAESVLTHIDKWAEENVFTALADETKSLEVRLKNGLSQIRALYDGGKESCFFRAFSMQSGLELFEQSINKGLNRWINVFTEWGISSKLPPTVAKENAIQTLIEIQGSLIVAKGLGSIQVFENTLQNIENRYLKT